MRRKLRFRNTPWKTILVSSGSPAPRSTAANFIAGHLIYPKAMNLCYFQ
jgi:hypothetical protein